MARGENTDPGALSARLVLERQEEEMRARAQHLRDEADAF